MHEDFPREAITLGNQLVNLQSSFLKLICLRSCHKDFFPPVVLFLLCKESIPFAHHGPTQVRCPGVSEHPWLPSEGESFERKARKIQKHIESRRKTHCEPLLFLLPSPHFLLPPLFFFFNFICSIVYLACNECEMLFLHFLRVRIQEQDFKGLHANTLL